MHSILEKSHFLLLPSKSEGFPKVVAEAACYGVVPVVSNVGSIAHYINDKNGFLWNIKSEFSYSKVLLKGVMTDEKKLKQMSKEIESLAEKFTFNNYIQKLNELIFFK